MKDQLKWVLNHMPKSDDQHLDVMSLPNVAKARSFHAVSYTHLTLPTNCTV